MQYIINNFTRWNKVGGCMNKVTIIIPVYNEGDALENNFKLIDQHLQKINMDLNYMFVDDGSSDNTWQVLKKLYGQNKHVNGIRFSRNFGKEIAILAGVKNVYSDYYVVMDSDLQHPPQHVEAMLKLLIDEEVNIVEGVKLNRGKETMVYKITTKLFYKTLHVLTHMDMHCSSDFKVFDQTVAKEILKFQEKNVFFRGIVEYLGFKKLEYSFDVEERVRGKSSFNFWRLAKLALTAIVSHTSKPLYLTIFSGGIFLVIAIIMGIQTLVNYFSGSAVSGFSTVILLILITGSMLMMSIGIIGVYIANIYNEVKNRPQYIVADKLVEEKVEI